jgi:RNA polymerase-binding transcription factor DksA
MVEMDDDIPADPADLALKNEAILLNFNLEAQRHAAKPKQVRNPDGTWPDPECVSCGNDIGEARLQATGSDLCIFCATAEEKRRKNRGY